MLFPGDIGVAKSYHSPPAMGWMVASSQNFCWNTSHKGDDIRKYRLEEQWGPGERWNLSVDFWKYAYYTLYCAVLDKKSIIKLTEK